ncbi:MAG TPA: M20/M25/M40 family metallo-hydrolase [Casimicrobiaceae bacterium]|nr:M20/M25/M40 family metallo-hydrolase [Casimicrobiaceae bacterium]
MSYKETLGKVLGQIREPDLVEFTRAVARIPSIHGDEYAIGEAFYARMRELGIDTEKLHVEGNRFNVFGQIKGGGGGRSLMFNGHMDTVEELLGWTKAPYGGELVDGKIYGHGVSNMKASDTAMVYALDAIKRAGIKLKGDCSLALVVGECHGGVGTKALMKQGVRSEVFLCTEPTYLNVLNVHAYSQYFRVNIIGRTGHFGTHDHGLNAIMKMYELTDRLGPMHEDLGTAAWIKFTDKPQYDGLPRYHLGTIRGGLTRECREGPSNTPDFCSGILNVRATPNKKIESTMEDISRVLDEMREKDPGFKYEISIFRDMKGFEAKEGSVAVDAASRAYTDVMGEKPNVGPIQPYMFMASDSGHMQAVGMNDGALIGPGAFTSSVVDEHVEVTKLVAAAKIFAAAALRVCDYVESEADSRIPVTTAQK